MKLYVHTMLSRSHNSLYSLIIKTSIFCRKSFKKLFNQTKILCNLHTSDVWLVLCMFGYGDYNTSRYLGVAGQGLGNTVEVASIWHRDKLSHLKQISCQMRLITFPEQIFNILSFAAAVSIFLSVCLSPDLICLNLKAQTDTIYSSLGGEKV